MHQVLIAGGGISGLSAAYYLTQLGLRPVIVEKQPRLGGVIQTHYEDGFVVEAGPDSFLAAKPWAMDLIRELGLEDQVIGSNDHLRVTYIRKKGRMIPLPEGLMMMVPTRIWPVASSSLLSWATKMRMGLEWFQRPDAGSGQDRPVSEFIRAHYGQEALDYLAEPLLAGVYGGDPDQLGVAGVLPRFAELEAQYGSLTRGVLVEGGRTAGKLGGGSLFRTLKGGLGQLVAALEQSLAGKADFVHEPVAQIARGPRGFSVRAGAQTLDAKHVILAVPAHVAAGLLEPLDAGPLQSLLAGIPYNSSVTVAVAYRKPADPELKGFGFLIPRKERKRLVACTYVGTKFSHRVPDDHLMLRCFLGGAFDEAILGESDEAISAIVRDEIRELTGIAAEPLFMRISRWPASMAQYTVGHGERVKSIEQALAGIPGLHVAGNAYHGIGIPDCVRSGKLAAEKCTGLSLRIDF